MKFDNNFLTQIYTYTGNTDDGPMIYTRSYIDGATWTSWVQLVNKNALKSKTISGTTDSNGYISLNLNNAYSIIYLRSTDASDHQVNLTTGVSSWWVRITLNGNAVANKSVNIKVKYFEF